jgi:hypothetical protein
MANLNLRDRLTKTTPEQREEERLIGETTKIWEYVKQSRRRAEYEWFINDVYYSNNQYLKYNTQNRRVQGITVERINDRVVINKVKQQVRGIVNFLNAEHPEIGVRPGDEADDAYLRAKKEKNLCDFWYRHLKMNSVAKKISLDGAKYGIGWGKILWDNDALSPTTPFTNNEGGISNKSWGEVMVDRCDPFEVYPDPMAQTTKDMRYLIHAPVRTIGELKANPLYTNTDQITADHRLASSIMKQSELRLQISNAQVFSFGQANDMDTVVVLEIFRKIFNAEAKKWEIWVLTRTEAGVLLRNQKWEMNEFPFVCFQTDIAGMLGDSKGVIHDIREPNRALNEMVSQVHESARIMGKLNWLLPRGSNVNVITDETGQFIEYDVTPGGAPKQAEAVNLPNYIMQHISLLSNFMEDISGMHASFNGKPPFAQASGDLVETLSAGDQNNLTMMRDNYDDFFVDVFRLMLKTYKLNGSDTTKKFPTGQYDEFGEVRWMEAKPGDISTDDDLAVSTGTAMPYSIADKQQMYMNLWKEKAITDPALLFKLLEMPDIDNAMGDDEPDIERQLNEIRSIQKGTKPPDPEIFENHQVHIETIDKFGRGDGWLKLNKKQQQMLRDHRQAHISFSIQLSQIQNALNVSQIKRSETLMVRPTSIQELTPIERTQWFSKWGINSDAASIQLRGGLFIQDPQQAEMQAQNEDIEMMSERAVQVSFGDNHLVHLETHAALLDAVMAKGYSGSQVTKELIQAHVKDHLAAMQSVLSVPGLVPNDQVALPNPANLKDAGSPGEMPQSGSGQPSNATPAQQSAEAARQQQVSGNGGQAAILKGKNAPSNAQTPQPPAPGLSAPATSAGKPPPPGTTPTGPPRVSAGKKVALNKPKSNNVKSAANPTPAASKLRKVKKNGNKQT